MHSREHLLHVLAEAAELEHNILCSYLYAAFSLKTRESEDLSSAELAKVAGWRKELMGICIEEMIHLAQVANLMVAVGSRPHFDRPNLPVAKGYHPAAIELALAPFDVETLDHFIFLERPEEAHDRDARPLGIGGPARPDPDAQELMPAAPDYQTIGEFYAFVRAGLATLAGRVGEDKLFCGPAAHQLRGDELGSEDLLVVRDLAGALAAVDFIVVQGEGSAAHREESHYRRLSEIRDEYLAMQQARPAFVPHRPVARNPVMRVPQADGRVHVTGARARPYLDAANAAYAAMLRVLATAYDAGAAGAARTALVGAAMALMHLLAALSDALTLLPASDAPGAPNAGVTFTVLRSTEGFSPGADAVLLLVERLDAILVRLRQLPDRSAQLDTGIGALAEAAATLRRARPA